MKKYVIGGVLAVAIIAYVVFLNENKATIAIQGSPTGTPGTPAPTGGTSAGIESLNPGATSGAGSPSGSGSSGTGVAGSGTGAGGTGTSGTGSTASNGKYKDGTYTGAMADAFYGNLQAVVTVSGGKIAKITFTQYPTGGHSGAISSEALPILAQESISTQSAQVDAVSGATQTSNAFVQTVGSALAKAKA